MDQKLVYDLPTRIFHALFAVLFLGAFAIAKTVDDESVVFTYHMLAGFTLVFLVLLRVFWGFFGTKHARFSGFALRPSELIRYFRDLLAGGKARWAGHNPASSWAAISMLVFAVGLGITGYLMTAGPNKEAFEDVHELFANGMIVVVVLHLAGIVLHTIRHKDLIGLSMVHGKKEGVPGAEAIASSRNGVGVLFIALVVAFGVHMLNNYDGQTGSLKVFGSTLQLAENEDGHGGEGGVFGAGGDEDGGDDGGDDDDGEDAD